MLAEFEISPNARRRYLVAVDPEVLSRVQHLARMRGLSIESVGSKLMSQISPLRIEILTV